MLLKSLTLNNIRSYKEQTINFKDGITLLSGDIGCGKSSILLAVEFALFGASRPDLPAESLIRKGQTKASVTLQFQLQVPKTQNANTQETEKLENSQLQDIIIHRTLQQTNQGVRQGSGYIIINGIKNELTALELRAKIIELLGYPEDSVTKGKNHVYRYTVYCPQEDMKLILQESAETRLDILRKVFNIDKYKIIRDNVIIYLKTLRKELTILETRAEKLDEKEVEFLTAQDKINQLTKELEESKKQRDSKLEDFQKQKQIVEKIQETEKQRKNLMQEEEKTNLLLKELNSQKSQQEIKWNNLQEQRKSLLLSNSYEISTVEEEINSCQLKKTELENRNTSFKLKIESLQDTIRELKRKKESSSNIKEEFESLTKKKESLIIQLSRRDDQEKVKQETLEKVQESIKEESTLIEKLNQTVNKIESFSSLTHCPTCEQDVPQTHCEKILVELKVTKEVITKKLQDIENSKLNMQDIIKKIDSDLFNLKEVEINIQKITNNLTRFDQILKSQEEVHENLKTKVKENNLLMHNYSNFLNQEYSLKEDVDKRINNLQKIKEKLQILQRIEDGVKELSLDIDKTRQRIDQTEQQSLMIKKNLQNLPNQETKLLENKQLLETLQETLNKSEIVFSNLQKEIMLRKEQLQNQFEEVKSLRQTKSEATRVQERIYWINNQFIPLMQKIEQEIMLKIYSYCNGLFSEWFEILTEGSNLHAKLDSSFTPIIEQQGHEILFAHLSGGERTAASLAYRLALTKVINDVVPEIKTKELLILDEPTDGFSSEQLQRLRDCLEVIGLKQILIVSHEAMMEGFVNHIVTVEKQSGVSRVQGV